jgi:hypothetical protein
MLLKKRPMGADGESGYNTDVGNGNSIANPMRAGHIHSSGPRHYNARFRPHSMPGC